MQKKYPLSRQENIVVQELDGEVLIYDLIKNKAFCLNETSALVWNLCDGTKSIAELSNLLGKKLNAPANEDIVWLAIDQLKKEKLIENETELVSPFLGMSRREVIKKVGLGTMIALPIVASLIAPTAAFAQSCGGATATGGACATDANCMSCCCASLICAPFMTVANGSPATAVCQCSTGSMITGGMCAA